MFVSGVKQLWDEPFSLACVWEKTIMPMCAIEYNNHFTSIRWLLLCTLAEICYSKPKTNIIMDFACYPFVSTVTAYLCESERVCVQCACIFGFGSALNPHVVMSMKYAKMLYDLVEWKCVCECGVRVYVCLIIWWNRFKERKTNIASGHMAILPCYGRTIIVINYIL